MYRFTHGSVLEMEGELEVHFNDEQVVTPSQQHARGKQAYLF
jgi:hypothetical protein